MSRRVHSGPSNEAGNDSFLDILANLVGILVILVVVVSIRVQQTVQVDQPVTETEIDPVETLPEPHPIPPVRETIVLGPEDLPINGLFANPPVEYEAEPTANPALLTKLDSARSQLAALTATPIATTDDESLEATRSAILTLSAELDANSAFVARVQTELEERRTEYRELKDAIGRAVAELEEELPPETTFVSLEHDVRAIARVAGSSQFYVELAENHVTLLPIKSLVPRMLKDLNTKVGRGRLDGTYEGRVGPVGGVSFYYSTSRGGSSPIDSLNDRPGGLPLNNLTFAIDISSSATSEPIDLAITDRSVFAYELARAAPGTSVTAFVYPDSFAGARKLQEALQARGVRLALQPIPEGVPIIHSPDGARAMSQ